MRLSRRFYYVAAILFAVAATAFMPLRWIVGAAIPEKSMVAASGADGTIWSGRVYDVQLGKLGIGTLDAGIQPLGVFLGRVGFWFEQPATAGLPGFRGTVSKGFGGVTADGWNGSVPVAEILPGFPAAQLEFDNVSVSYSAGKCRTASGSVRIKPEGPLFAALGVDAGLIGRVRCEASDLLLPLASASAMERVELRISADGRYRATVQLQQPSAEIAPMLSLAGFAPIAGGYRKSGNGRFW
jgi:general secretion pathway protein N